MKQTIIPRVRAISVIEEGKLVECRVYDRKDSFMLITPTSVNTVDIKLEAQ